MKTFEQVSEKAIQIADNDPNAVVAVFDLRVKQKLDDCKHLIQNGVLKVQSLQYVSSSGGMVMFFDAGWNTWDHVAGYQFTHVFCSEFVDPQDQRLIASRIRYKNPPHPEPAGLYSFYGTVQRKEVW